MNEEKTKEQLQKDYDELNNQFSSMLTYVAFCYGMAAAGNPLAIKLVKLHANEDEDQFEYTISMKAKP